MLANLRGLVAAALCAAAVCGCYSGSKEPASAGVRGGDYAKGEKLYGFYGPGIAALEAGKLDQARRVFAKRLSSTPKDAEANYLAGLVQLAGRDLKGALKFFGRAASYNPAMTAAHQQQGVTLARLGRKDEALATFALLETQATACRGICAEATDLRAAIAAISAALGQDAPSPMAASPLRDGRWLAPGSPITVLSHEPGSCYVIPSDEKAALAVNIGRAAFRAPQLLGGEAARQGLSCATCHRNGRNNPEFFLSGVSDKPGTADVTTSVLSSHRGDGIFNPKPIPDLAAPEGKRLISRDVATGALEAFIHGVIVKEFDGAEPPTRVLEGLSAYVRSISARTCGPERKVSLSFHLGDASAAMGAATRIWVQGDPATARLMVASARTALGMVDERYAPSTLTADRRTLRSADLGLEAIYYAMGKGASDIPLRILSWRVDMTQWTGSLKAREAQSLYNPAVLKGEHRYALQQ